MKLGTKTALGIDISESLINLALLKKTQDGLELVKAASIPVPDGVIKDGTIEDPETLSKTIKELKSRNKIRASQAAVSLFTRPVVMQIIDMPEPIPANIRQFIYDEVKGCVVLSGKDIALDFCGISSKGRRKGRVFVVATDEKNVADITKVCNKAKLNIAAIEPPLLAYAGAFYSEKIAGKFDCKVLMALLRGNTLTLSVFKNQVVDFVRTKDIAPETTTPDELCQWLADQINSIVQFYDVEDSDNCRKWEISVIVDESVKLPKEAEKSLRAELRSDNLQIIKPENACQYVRVDPNSGPQKPSLAAVSLAMKLLSSEQGNLRVDMLPGKTSQLRSAKKHVLLTALIAAAVLLVMLLANVWLNMTSKKVNEKITRINEMQPLQHLHTLHKEQKLLNKRIGQLSDIPHWLSSIQNLQLNVDWPSLLNDIRHRIPKTTRLPGMSNPPCRC